MINKLAIYLPQVLAYARIIRTCTTPRYLNADAMPGNATFLVPLFQTTYFSGASSNLSITYFPLATNWHTRHLSNPPLQVPVIRRHNKNLVLLNPIHKTIIRIHALRSHCNRSHLSPLAIRNAILYLGPSFSSSAMTQDVIIGMHLAYGQSIMLSRRGSFRCTVWDRKLVSTRTE
jgi:hypothetical protein